MRKAGLRSRISTTCSAGTANTSRSMPSVTYWASARSAAKRVISVPLRFGVVMSIVGRIGGEDAGDIRHDDEVAAALADAADEFRPPAHADARRFLERRRGDRGHLVDLVGADADDRRITVEIDLDHDDAGVDGRRLEL